MAPALAKHPANPWPDRPPGAGNPSRAKPGAAPTSGAPDQGAQVRDASARGVQASGSKARGVPTRDARASGAQANDTQARGNPFTGARDPRGTPIAGAQARGGPVGGTPISATQASLAPAAGAQARAAAARLVGAVLREGRSLTEALERLSGLDQERDRPLVQELSYGTLRLLPRLQAVARQLLNKPLRPEEAALEALILIGLYQLLATRIPPHAAVASTVAATRVLGKDWAAGLVNALLRRFQRERAALLAVAERDEEARWLFPRWLLERLRQDWPEDWEEIVAASNAQAPQWLRVNRLALERDAYRARLSPVAAPQPPGSDSPAPSAIPDAPASAPAALRLDPPLPMARLPGYAEGLVSIQDLHAQLAAPLLEVQPGERVLDACAAPGGKTAHLLELAAGRLDLTALDLDPARLAQVTANLRRLGLQARVLAGDAAGPSADWVPVAKADMAEADASVAGSPRTDLAGTGVAFGGQAGDSSLDGSGPPPFFDRILLDAPCSATGVIRRHPDIKWLRRPTDIEALAARQTRLLEALWPLLAPGGTLLYVTCSLLATENEQVIRAFLSRHRDAVEAPIVADWGRPRASGRQVLPTLAGGDGFYFARLRKEAP